MKVFNTMTRQKEELVPLTPGEFKIYACGPTVYNFIHIGNARPICVFDVLRRYLEFLGNKVTFVQTFTIRSSTVQTKKAFLLQKLQKNILQNTKRMQKVLA